jgi:hypothetical protein
MDLQQGIGAQENPQIRDPRLIHFKDGIYFQQNTVKNKYKGYMQRSPNIAHQHG